MNEYQSAMKCAAYEEMQEVSAHIQTALGHLIAADESVFTARVASIWQDVVFCINYMGEEECDLNS